jgi:phytoene dehydrogenase-like protein
LTSVQSERPASVRAHSRNAGGQRQRRRAAIYRPLVQVSLGVAADFSGQPRAVSFPIPTPVPIAGEVREQLTLTHYAYDPTLAPSGKTSLAVLMDTDYAWWAGLARDPAAYAAEKEQIAETVQAILMHRFGTLVDRIEQVDVATPLTWERHTGNCRGSYEGWLPTRSAMAENILGGMRRTLPGLDGFWMVGPVGRSGWRTAGRRAGSASADPAVVQTGSAPLWDHRRGGRTRPGTRHRSGRRLNRRAPVISATE